MTLVVYDGNTLYADRFIKVDEYGSDSFHLVKGKKLLQNNLVAIACLGPAPHKEDFKSVFKILTGNVYLYEVHGKFYWYDSDMPNAMELCFPSPNTSYMVITRAGMYKFQSAGMHVLNNNVEVAEGSGCTFYTIARQAGHSVLDAYQIAANYERTVGGKIDFCHRTDLLDIKTYAEEREREKSEQHDTAQE